LKTELDIDAIAAGLADRATTAAQREAQASAERQRIATAESAVYEARQRAVIRTEMTQLISRGQRAKQELEAGCVPGTTIFCGLPRRESELRRELNSALLKQEQLKQRFPYLRG
jgi:hypothetical protein